MRNICFINELLLKWFQIFISLICVNILRHNCLLLYWVTFEKIMKNIAVVFGGYSSEFEVSVKSGKFIYVNLKDSIDWNIYEVCI